MSWQKKNTAEHKEVLDMQTGMHIIPLIHPSGAEHKLQINVRHESCPHCGHVHPQTELGELDVKKIVEDEIALLNQNQAAVADYVARHRLPVRGKTR